MIEEFLKENTWSKLHVQGEAPCVRTGHCVSSFGNDAMYVFGGYSETGVLNDMHRLDIMMKTWSKVEYSNNYITEIPSGRASAQLCAYAQLGMVFLFGGTGMESHDLAKSEVFSFDIYTQRWRSFKGGLVPPERFGHSMVLHNNYVYSSDSFESNLVVFGGARVAKQANGKVTSEYLNDLWMFSLIEKQWRKLTPSGNLPSPRYRQEIVVYQNSLYLIGGGTANERFSTIFRYDFTPNTWQQINLANANQQANNKKDLLFRGRMGHICMIDEGEILIYGGVEDSVNTEPLAYSIEKRIWKKKYIKGKHPKAREFFSGCKFQHAMVLFGGRVGEKKVNDLYMWNLASPTPSIHHCTLRREMTELYFRDENQGDIQIICTKDQKPRQAHSYIIKHRSPGLLSSLQSGKFEGSSAVFDILMIFIYGGRLELERMTQEILLDLLQFAISSDMKYLFRIAVFYYLVSQNNTVNSIEEVETQLIRLSGKCIEPQTSFYQSLLAWIDNRKNQRYNSGQASSSNKQKASSNDKNDEITKAINSFNASFLPVWNLNAKLYYSDMLGLKSDVGSANFDLIAGDKTFKVHKAILSARCGYFESCFGENYLANTNSLTISPELYNGETLIIEFLVNFFYNGFEEMSKTTLNYQTLIKCLEVTNYFQVKSPTFSFLIENAIFNQGITLDNCFQTLKFAEQFQALFLQNKTIIFMTDNMTKILAKHSNELLGLSPSMLVHMLQIQNDKEIAS